jgi:hypothetical protein
VIRPGSNNNELDIAITTDQNHVKKKQEETESSASSRSKTEVKFTDFQQELNNKARIRIDRHREEELRGSNRTSNKETEPREEEEVQIHGYREKKKDETKASTHRILKRMAAVL